jgi:integrase
MARLKKLGKIYYISQDEKVYFDPANPPKGTTRNTKGKIPSRVQRALDRGHSYYFKTKWHNTGETVGWLAERKLDDWNRKRMSARTGQAGDVLLKVAVDSLSEYFQESIHYSTQDKYVLTALSNALGMLSMGSIQLGHWETYCKREREGGISASTLQRRFTVLRTIYREAKRRGIYTGINPFVGMSGRTQGNPPRKITLEVEQQDWLRKCCYDPELAAIFDGVKHLDPKTRAFPEGTLEQLGYPAEKYSFEMVWDHMKYWEHSRNMTPQILRDLVELELTFGLRLAEIVGMSYKRAGKSEVRGGLRVGHYDPVKKSLVVIRSKQKRDRNVKEVSRKTTFPVPPYLAEILGRYCKGKGQEDLIFTTKTGKPVEKIHIWRAFAEAASFSQIKVPVEDIRGLTHLEVLSFRDLRHVAASNMIERAGFGLHDVARYLGHSNTHMLEQVYYNERTQSQLDKHRNDFAQLFTSPRVPKSKKAGR